MVDLVHQAYIFRMIDPADHLRDAERLERQAEIADSQHARAALRRMAEASRMTAAFVAMLDASGDERDRPHAAPVA